MRSSPLISLPMETSNGKLFALGILSSDPPPVAIPWSRSYTVPARMAGKTVELQGVIGVGGTRYVTNRIRLLILP